MYGLLLENLSAFITKNWGEGKLESVLRHAGIDNVAFSTHFVYSERIMQKLIKSSCQVLAISEQQFLENMGLHFILHVSKYGFHKMLSVLGRQLRDFLNGLDNLHAYIKYSYPKMRAPSFFCDSESSTGLRLHYRSRRRGFVYYVMGQIKQVAAQFYHADIEIVLISEEFVEGDMHAVFQIHFDNSAFATSGGLQNAFSENEMPICPITLPIEATTIFDLFPFCILFNQDMEIKHTGHALTIVVKDLVCQSMTETFDMTRPLVPFCFSVIMERINNVFELLTVAPISDYSNFSLSSAAQRDDDEDIKEGTRLRLRGQMMYMENFDCLLFLCNPVMKDLSSLINVGLFINDLALHDCSRDLVLAGTQQSVELKLALDQEQQKSRKIVESMKKIDEEMKRTDELLYQMIPRQVADRIRNGCNPVDTCEVFECVSILFSDIVSFTRICSSITPMQVVLLLNHMYSLFDQLTERNLVYKVETIGDSYMVVSGAPDKDSHHAERICDMALDMIDACTAIEDPSDPEKLNCLKIRVGCHSGTVVAGIVGIKMPRYCLFGDTVNSASRMEATSEPGRIQISEPCKIRLPNTYQYAQRGTVFVKGKGNVNTYWLCGRTARVPLSKFCSKSIIWSAPISKSLSRQPILDKRLTIGGPDFGYYSSIGNSPTPSGSEGCGVSIRSLNIQGNFARSHNREDERSNLVESRASSYSTFDISEDYTATRNKIPSSLPLLRPSLSEIFGSGSSDTDGTVSPRTEYSDFSRGSNSMLSTPSTSISAINKKMENHRNHRPDSNFDFDGGQHAFDGKNEDRSRFPRRNDRGDKSSAVSPSCICCSTTSRSGVSGDRGSGKNFIE